VRAKETLKQAAVDQKRKRMTAFRQMIYYLRFKKEPCIDKKKAGAGGNATTWCCGNHHTRGGKKLVGLTKENKVGPWEGC